MIFPPFLCPAVASSSSSIGRDLFGGVSLLETKADGPHLHSFISIPLIVKQRPSRAGPTHSQATTRLHDYANPSSRMSSSGPMSAGKACNEIVSKQIILKCRLKDFSVALVRHQRHSMTQLKGDTDQRPAPGGPSVSVGGDSFAQHGNSDSTRTWEGASSVASTVNAFSNRWEQ